MHRYILSLLLLLCLAPARADTVTVAVAANMQYAFEELRAEFSRQSGNGVDAVYGSSGKLVAQIESGAPFDLFLSADMDYPRKLYERGLVSDPPRPYAYGAVVLWTLEPLDLGKWRELLRSDAVKKVAIANPKTAPYGSEAMKVLAHEKLLEDVEPKLVFGESIAQTSQYIFSQAADIGFTAKSVVLSPQMKGKGSWIDMPEGSYDPIAQGTVVLKHGDAEHSKTSEAFLRFLFSPAAREVLTRYGYSLPAAASSSHGK